MKTAIVTNHYNFQNRFLELEEFQYMYDDVLPIRSLHMFDLLEYDTIILQEHLCLLHLKRYCSQLIKFLERGRRLVIMGEVMDHWFPGIMWENSEVNFSWWVKKDGDLPLIQKNKSHEIYNYINFPDLKWHYHGTFCPPKGAISLAETPEGKSIFYIDSVSYNGELIVTSVDPTYHIGLGFITQAKPFLHGLAKYLRIKKENFK